MYSARIDVETQTFIIEDRDGVIIAIRTMPVSRCPNPGREALMAETDNLAAWVRIMDLVEAANGN